MLPLKRYQNDAIKLIKYHKYNYLLNNQDALDYVVSYMINADLKFDQEYGDGGCSRNGFRAQYAKYGIKSYLRDQQRQEKVKSLTMSLVREHNDVRDRLDRSPSRDIENKEMLARLLNRLPVHQRDYVVAYYMYGYTLEEIAYKYNKSAPTILHNIRRALETMRLKYVVQKEGNEQEIEE